MSKQSKVNQIAGLLEKVAKLHHQAFADVGGEDPEWASWYADKLLELVLEDVLGVDISANELVNCRRSSISKAQASFGQINM